jgi:hypothetical protein
MLLSIKILIKLDEREERKMEMFVKIKNMVGSVKYRLLIEIAIGVKLVKIAYELLRSNVATWTPKK